MAILLISPEPWRAHNVSKHHFARTLASQGYRVLFLDPPDPTRKAWALEPVPGYLSLEVVRAKKLAPGLRLFPMPLRRWLETRWLQRLERLAGCTIEVVWLFENSRFFDLRFAGSRLKIYHQVDLNQAFHPVTAAQTADVCFCTTELIRQRLLPHNPHCYRLHHGVASGDVAPSLAQAEQQHFAADQIQAMYVGNLEMAYLDVELLVDVINRHPDVRFHLVGGYRLDSALFQLLGTAINVVWWGHIPSTRIPTLLKCVDLLMVCYQAQHHADQSNPHKLMEYLASGRVVVATYTAEFVAQQHLVAMSEPGSNRGYPELFASVIATLNVWNSSEKVALRRSFAAEFTYERQLQRIQSYLKHLSLPFPAPLS